MQSNNNSGSTIATIIFTLLAIVFLVCGVQSGFIHG